VLPELRSNVLNIDRGFVSIYTYTKVEDLSRRMLLLGTCNDVIASLAFDLQVLNIVLFFVS
jgi:hypothetical protein